MSRTMNAIAEIDRLFEKHKIIILKEIDMGGHSYYNSNFLYVVYICQEESSTKRLKMYNINKNTDSDIKEYKTIFWNMPHEDILTIKEALFVNPLKMIEAYYNFKLNQNISA